MKTISGLLGLWTIILFTACIGEIFPWRWIEELEADNVSISYNGTFYNGQTWNILYTDHTEGTVDLKTQDWLDLIITWSDAPPASETKSLILTLQLTHPIGESDIDENPITGFTQNLTVLSQKGVIDLTDGNWAITGNAFSSLVSDFSSPDPDEPGEEYLVQEAWISLDFSLNNSITGESFAVSVGTDDETSELVVKVSKKKLEGP